jgi:hypothetical protein
MINLWDIKLSQCFIVKHNYYKSEIYKFQLIGFTDTIVYIRNIDLHGKMMKPSDDDKIMQEYIFQRLLILLQYLKYYN